MPPAARAFDQTAHGSPLAGAGSPDVFLGGRPAWRAFADFSPCPATTGPAPHVGGVVTMGSSTVFVNGLPAVRQGDTVIESGPPNTVVGGCPSVNIG